MVKRYRKLPVVIEAIQLGEDNFEALGEFVGAVAVPALLADGSTGLYIHTLEGDMLANLGDYIIKGVKGEFYPCKPDIFEATYEEVS